MAESNLLSGLKSKLASLTGAANALEERIDRIKSEYAKLDSLEGELVTLRIKASKVVDVIKMDHDDFDENAVVPRKPYTHRLPIKNGECSQTVLDILRTASEPMTSRDIALAVLARHKVPDDESGIRIAVTNAVDSTLRAHKEKLLAHDDNWPRRWWIASRRQMAPSLPALEPLPALPVPLPLTGNGMAQCSDAEH